MALLNQELSQVLTPTGFYNTVKQLTPVLTVEQAYEEVEKTHEAISGRRRYRDFNSFETIKKRYDQRKV